MGLCSIDFPIRGLAIIEDIYKLLEYIKQIRALAKEGEDQDALSCLKGDYLEKLIRYVEHENNNL